LAIEIKVLRPGDEGILSNVAADVFDDTVDSRSTELSLGNSNHHLAVALDSGVVIGFASGVHYFHPDKPQPELFVNEIGIAPTHQGQGIGKGVFTALLESRT
jgi:aminoglycoside 6'-N-acetyltransferase I